MPAAQPHLSVKGKIICRQLPLALRHATTFPPYKKFLQNKYSWKESDMAAIHWEIMTAALSSFPQEDQRRLVLFINNKLPLRASKMHPHYGSKFCPSCQREQEDNNHFIRCRNRERVALFNSLHRTMTAATQKLQLHPCIFTAFWLGLVSSREHSPYPDVANDVPRPLRHPIHQQQSIGWDQLYHGRIARTWTQAVNLIHPASAGDQVMIRLQRFIWQYILDTWALRNQHLHHQAQAMNVPDFQQAARNLYKQRDRLNPTAQEALYRQPLEQVLELPAP